MASNALGGSFNAGSTSTQVRAMARICLSRDTFFAIIAPITEAMSATRGGRHSMHALSRLLYVERRGVIAPCVLLCIAVTMLSASVHRGGRRAWW
jgi:hypothetical protein